MTELYKRIKTICEKENFQSFTEKDNHFLAFRENERIYFNEYRPDIFELRKTGMNNIKDVRTWCHSYSHLTSDTNIINHLNWCPLNGLTIDLAKELIDKEITWTLYNFLNNEEASGVAIIQNVNEKRNHPLEVKNISGDDLSKAYFDGNFFMNDLKNVLKYNNHQSYIAFKKTI